jgi:hypothetical protein
MDRPRRATSVRLFPPSILVVACAPSIVERCLVAATVSGLDVHASGYDGAAALAAERRPIAIVAPDDLLSFEAIELEGLARAVGATLVELDADVCQGEIAAMLAGAVNAYLKRGARGGAGRYAIIGKGPIEVVGRPVEMGRPAVAVTSLP